jgi:hypothetical protein
VLTDTNPIRTRLPRIHIRIGREEIQCRSCSSSIFPAWTCTRQNLPCDAKLRKCCHCRTAEFIGAS